MDTLFPLNPVLPSGFVYVPDFISLQEEDQLIQLISEIELHKFLFQGHEAKRRVASFGYDYSFDKRILTEGKQIPSTFIPIVEKVSEFLSIPKGKFGELLVTEYPVGSVINWHRDAPPFDLIAGLSLHSDCIFKLRPHDKEKQGRKSIISIPVKRRSLYIMQGSARTDWQHSTAPVKEIRYSITLRTLRPRA
jgi:alkylated DNA repair dioxygenase AlkB